VELLEVHEVVDAGEEEPLAAPEPPDLGMLKRAWIGLVA
jgi:hypothetical protein